MTSAKVLTGFCFFILGSLCLILRLVGMQFIFMEWFEDLLQGWTVLAYSVFCVGGLMLAYVGVQRRGAG